MEDKVLKNMSEDSLQVAKSYVNQMMNYYSSIQQMIAENERLRQRAAELESENASLTESLEQCKVNEGWSSRVTYDNVVDQIASNEDAAQRDQARKLIRSGGRFFDLL